MSDFSCIPPFVDLPYRLGGLRAAVSLIPSAPQWHARLFQSFQLHSVVCPVFYLDREKSMKAQAGLVWGWLLFLSV